VYFNWRYQPQHVKNNYSQHRRNRPLYNFTSREVANATETETCFIIFAFTINRDYVTSDRWFTGKVDDAMTAYIFAEVKDVSDPEAFREYREKVAGTMEPFGGKAIIRGSNFETLEGSWNPQGFIVIEFPDRQSAMEWYGSAQYKPLLELRMQLASTNSVIMDA
jgi:uncharacterized protein (DUF1330 family)